MIETLSAKGNLIPSYMADVQQLHSNRHYASVDKTNRSKPMRHVAMLLWASLATSKLNYECSNLISIIIAEKNP